MNRVFAFLQAFIRRLKRLTIFNRYSAAAALAEGSGKMARDFLEDNGEEQERYAELRLEFKARYHNFKLLLQANKCALENMASIEKALQDNKPFSMSFVREKITAISVDVFRMIRNMEEIAPEKYPRLPVVYDAIELSIHKLLEPNRELIGDRLVVPFSEIDSTLDRLVGNKMAKIGEIRNKLGLKVPDGFVITTAAYHKLLEHSRLQEQIDKQFQGIDYDDMRSVQTASTNIQQLIMDAAVPNELETSIKSLFQAMFPAKEHPAVALRSSAQGEDLAGTSFAGQYHSELNVSEQTLIEAFKRVIASKYGLKAITYRYNRGLKDEDIAMGVGCMLMIDSSAGGVVYSRNPVDINDTSIYIDSCWGLAKTVVEGNAAADQFVVKREPPYPIIRQHIKTKQSYYVCSPTGGVNETTISDEKQELPAIDGTTAARLADIAIKLEEYYGQPQDIEWALHFDGTIYILQCRPLSRMEKKERKIDPEEQINTRENLLAEGGICVCSGVASGPVHWIETKTDHMELPEGAILVTTQALPKWAPLLGKAAGIITEEGSFAGHLANVAREISVPALFGFGGLHQLLKNGTVITLDADHHAIHAGKVESLLVHTRIRKNLMADSPVNETLAAVSRHVVPLNLLDPDAADFRPSNCRTLHDITRFIHEKSVTEMFNFGKAHHFSARSAKQLFYKVPMQWWILNLDDGFVTETDNRYVTLDNIASVPMLALWQGIVAIPWEGPPPIDGRGLLSVMFQASTNMALTAGSGKQFADKNYFMISKNFCSLASRLGFHFSTVEAMISEVKEENYISFQFKGGAADYKRRTNRVLFLGELLERYGFSANIRKDNLIARLENCDSEWIKQRLVILGYLIIHTRQIDMIMLNNSSIDYYKTKFTNDIATLIPDSVLMPVSDPQTG